MKKIKKVLFGYSPSEVNSLINSYEKRIQTNEQNIAYLESRLKNANLKTVGDNKTKGKDFQLSDEIVKDIQSSINK